MKKRTRCAALLLAASLLAGCAPAASSALPEQVGGWVETDITPAELSPETYDVDLCVDGDTIRVVEKTENAIALHTSTDRGDSWQRTVPEWAQLPEDVQDPYFAISPGGTVYLRGTVEIPQQESGQPRTRDNLYLWQDGWQQIPLEEKMPLETEEGMTEVISDIQFDGETLAVCRGMVGQSFGLLQPDGSIKSYTTWDGAHGFQVPLLVRDGQIWGTNDSDQSFFTVDVAGQFCATQPSDGQILMDIQDGNLYGIKGKSVYVRAEDGTVWEEILDAEAAPRIQLASGVQQVRALDSECLLVRTAVGTSIWNDAACTPQLLHYDYDPDFVRPAARTVKVYSLEENATVRRAVFQCMVEHPELKIEYEVGMQENLEKEDVIKQLNTRLLAGDVPDVLVLDGLPVNSLVEQGILTDLSSLVDTGGLYPTARAGEQDGKLWYVTGRFVLPLQLGAGYELPDTLDQLAQDAENGPVLKFSSELQQRAVLGQPPEHIVAALLPGMRDSILQGGKIDRAALEALYSLADRLCSPVEDRDWLRKVWEQEGQNGEPAEEQRSFCHAAKSALEPLTSLHLLCQEMSCIDYKSSAAVDPGKSVIRSIPDTNAVYLPAAMAGIPAGASAAEDAAVFLGTLLSHAVQRQELGDGLPVRPESMRSQWELQPMRDYLFREDELYRQLEQAVEAADTAAVPDYFDEVVLETAKLDLPPAEAADQVCEQLQTWLAENK